jgi:predicted ABC-type ATPase
VGIGSLTQPHLIILAGPNGAGKSTSAPALMAETLGITEFVNADTIASGLSAFDPERAALEAGRVMLRRLKELAIQRCDFAFETTLAARTYAPWIAELITSGYAVDLFFLWLPSPDHAVMRVCQRVRAGGHNIPEETIRRRYDRGLANFFSLYKPLTTTWQMFDNSQRSGPRLVACGTCEAIESIAQPSIWAKISGSVK